MSREIYIHLITQFILIKPGRPFAEVQVYAEQIGASEEEIREAIFQVSTKLAERKANSRADVDDKHALSDPFQLIDNDKVPESKAEVPNFLKSTSNTPDKKVLFSTRKSEDTVAEKNLALDTQFSDTKSSSDEIFDKKVDEVIATMSDSKKDSISSSLPTLTIPGETWSEKNSTNTPKVSAQATHRPSDSTNHEGKHSVVPKDEDKKEKISASVQKIPKKNHFKNKLFKIPHPKAPKNILIATFLAPLLVLAGSVLTYHALTNAPEKFSVLPATKTAQDAQASNENFGVPVVYANHKSVDANRLFSFPTSDITLKYSGRPQKEVFGFFPYWMIGVHDKISIDSYTTIALFGLTSDSRGNIIASTSDEIDGGWAMWNDKRLDSFIARAHKKRVQVVLTIKSFNNEDIETLVLSNQAQKKFISNAVQLINLKSLDGINIDFEYIGTPDTTVTEGFTRLIANLNSEMKRQIPGSQLTIDTYLKSGGMRDLFDIQLLEEHVDAIVVMGYDVHTPNGTPGAVIPMEGPSSVVGFMQSYLERVSPKKLILALPYYGYDWPVKEEDREAHPPKAIPYAEIASFANKSNITWDETTQTPSYSYIDPESNVGRIVHFENPRSIGLKYDYINRKNLKGAGVWAMGYEGNNLELEQVLIDKFAQ